ncbi:MAG: hypothetical protein JWN78_1623 [Bacteroidota bacterium]|nr:hypothetical protein [Bacteroidota bacterium]
MIKRNLKDLPAEYIKKIVDSKPIIFVGSAISMFAPTNLLSGAFFCKKMYEYIFRQGQFKNGNNAWLKKEFENIPFEALMECFPRKDKLTGIIKSLFQNSKFNDAHTQLAKNLSDEILSALITPNYDLTLDTSLKKAGFNQFVINDIDFEHWTNQNDKRMYFKIHGSAEDGYEDTLIYTLSQEGSLKPWKIDLLTQLLQNKTIIFIGYSGRDFDICPLIAHLNIPCKIVWLHYSGDGKELTPYQDFLLNKKNDSELIYYESFTQFFASFFEQKVDVFKEDKLGFNPSAIFNLNDNELHEWQLNILSRMGCAKISKPILDSLKDQLDHTYYTNKLIDVYAQTGEYLKAVRTIFEFSKRYPKNSKLHLQFMINGSGFLLFSGYYICSSYYLFTAKKGINKMFPDDEELNISLQGNELTYWMRMFQLSKFQPFTSLTKYFSNKAEKLRASLLKLNTSGLWDSRQAIQQNLERLQMEEGSDLSLPSYKGYKNLGILGSITMAYRDKIRSNNWDDGEKAFEELDECIDRAENLGMNTELWKLCRIKFKNGISDKTERKEIWDKWKENLNVTEYHFTRKYISHIDLYWNYFKI